MTFDKRAEQTELLAQFLCAYIYKIGGTLTISVTEFNAIAGLANNIQVQSNLEEDWITITLKESTKEQMN